MAIETPLVALPKVMMPEICTPMVGDAMRDTFGTGHRHKEYFCLLSSDGYYLQDADGYELLAK